MMRKILFVFLLLYITPLIGQTGIVKSYYPNRNLKYMISYVEDIYEGTSFWFYENGNVKEEKTYSNGKLNGFIRRYFETGLLNEEFHVNNGIKDGLHKTYYDNGALKSVLSYERGILLKKIELDYDSLYSAPPEAYAAGNKQYELQTKKEELICDVDICPIPVGGMKVIQDNLIYPQHAKLYGLEGTVSLIAEVSDKGIVTSSTVISGIGLGCDEEAQRVVKATKFIPGQTNNKPVSSRITIRVEFKLSDKPTLAANTGEIVKRKPEIPTDPVVTQKPAVETKAEIKQTPKKESSAERNCDLEVCPVPKGGMNALLENLVIPSTAARVGVKGEVVIEVDVDDFGFVRDTKIIKGLGYGVDEACEVAVFETEFSPGSDKGIARRTKVKISIPVNLKE